MGRAAKCSVPQLLHCVQPYESAPSSKNEKHNERLVAIHSIPFSIELVLMVERVLHVVLYEARSSVTSRQKQFPRLFWTICGLDCSRDRPRSFHSKQGNCAGTAQTRAKNPQHPP